jgi:hypothetical protein
MQSAIATQFMRETIGSSIHFQMQWVNYRREPDIKMDTESYLQQPWFESVWVCQNIASSFAKYNLSSLHQSHTHIYMYLMRIEKSPSSWLRNPDQGQNFSLKETLREGLTKLERKNNTTAIKQEQENKKILTCSMNNRSMKLQRNLHNNN